MIAARRFGGALDSEKLNTKKKKKKIVFTQTGRTMNKYEPTIV